MSITQNTHKLGSTPFSWYLNDQLLPQEQFNFNPSNNQHKCNIGVICPETVGRYRCDIINKSTNKTITSTQTTIILDGQEPKILRTNFDTNIECHSFNEGDNITLQVYYSGNPLPSVSWLLDGEQLPPAAHTQTDCGDEGFVSTIFLDSAYVDDSGVYTFTIRNRLGVKQIETKIYVQPHANNDNQNNLSRLTEEPTNYNSEVIEEVVYDEVEETVEDLTEGLCHRNLVERQKQHDQEIENQRLQELERQKEIERNERIQREEHEKELQRQRHQEEIERREHEQKLEKERRARVDEERRLQTERVERQKELQRQRELEKAERERKELENQQRIERERMELERQLREQEQIEQQQREQEQREQQQREQQQREQQQQANRQRAVQKLPDLFPNKNKSQTVPTNIESIENLLPARPTDKIIKSAKISKVEEIQKQLHAENNNDLRHIPEDEALEEENLFDASVDDRVHTPEQPLQSPNSPIRQESQQKDSAISVNRSIESIKQQFNSPRQTEIPASISPPQDISPNKHSSAPNILQGLEDQSVPDSCTTFQWELIIESNPMPELTWFLNGEKITINGTEDEPFETFCEGLPDQSNAYRFIFKLKEVFPEDAGFWMVFVENEHGKAKSKASLHVNNVQG